MKRFSKKALSALLAFVLVLGVFSALPPTVKSVSSVKAETAAQVFDYSVLLADKSRGEAINDTRISGIADGIDFLGIWNSMGLAVRYNGALGISDRFFDGTAVGAEADEIHPYIVYNVTPGTSFSVTSAGYNINTHKATGCNDDERFFNFYVSNDGVTWIPIDAVREFNGKWDYLASYDEYLYTVENVGALTNFVKVEYPMTMTSRTTGYYPNESLMVCGVTFTPSATYNANGETLFQAKTLGQQVDLWEDYFIAYPDAICNATVDDNNVYKAGTLEYSMLNGKEWGTYADEKRRSLITMVKPGTRFYLETANQSYMQNVGKALVQMGELESADQARIRVYSSATLSDNAEDWTEHDPMPYCMPTATYTPTFNFYLPEDHIYVKIVYPHKGDLRTVSLNGSAVADEVGNSGCFFNDMVFTPYKQAQANVSYDYTNTATTGYTNISNLKTGDALGLRVKDQLFNNLPNGNVNNTGTQQLPKGFYSVTYEVEGGKMFSLDYALRNNSSTTNYGKGAYEANVGTTGSRMEFEISASNDGTNWYNFYETESGFAETTRLSSSDTRRLFDVHYLIPEKAKYVRVSFDLIGNGYIGEGSDVSYQRYFNDAMYIRNVSIADANNVADSKNYNYTVDSTATLAADKYKTSTSTATPDGSTAYTGDWGYLIYINNVEGIYAGTKARPYVVYDVKPATTFKADYKMRYKDIGFSEKYAQQNVDNNVSNASQDLVEFEFFIYGKSEKGDWQFLQKTSSKNLPNDGTFCYNSFEVKLPYYVEQVKVEFPNSGSFNREQTDGSVIDTYAGNDSAFLYNIQFVAPDSEQAGVNYSTIESSNIANTDKKDLSIYHHGGVSIVNSEGVKASRDNAFVIYKIKEGTSLTVKSDDDLAFEYSVDDKTYKEFDAAKVCGYYTVPAVSGKNYIRVKLTEGQAITLADCQLLPPTVNFYVPYLDKSYQIELENYGDTANTLTPAANMLRPGYTFDGWTNADDTEQIYIDTTYEAVYTKTDSVTYTVNYTVNGITQSKTGVKFDDRVTVTAPEENDDGQVFSKWVDKKGSTVSDNHTFSFLASGNLDLTAVYAAEKEALDPYIYTTSEPVITTNENGTWNMSVVWRTAMPADAKIDEAGIILGTDVDSADLVFWDGKVQKNTVKMIHSNISANKTAMYTVKNIAADKVRAARPYARLSDGSVIYGDMVKARSGVTVTSDFEFNGSISPSVLSNYLDRALTYSFDSAYEVKDVIRQTGAKYFARGLCHWEPSIYDVNRFETYKSNIAEIHQMDPEVIIEACIFETCGPKMNEIPIPAWVFEAFGLEPEERNFDYTLMAHEDGYMNDQWGEDKHVPSVSRIETQMFIYYRACCYIDMGVEAIHFGQMNLIGAVNGNSNVVDNASWTKVIDMITAYAKDNARRGYVIVNGHYPNQNLTRSDDSNTMLVDFNMFPLRIEASGTDHAATESNPQVCVLPTRASSDAPYSSSRQANVKNKISPSGYTYDSYPYMLEFDNWGVTLKDLDKATGRWGHDEISWYVNQPASYRHQYLTDISLQIKNMTSAPNGHVCLVGRRTAYISNTGCSEYLQFDWVQEYINTEYWESTNEETGEVTKTPNENYKLGYQIGAWDIRTAGDVDAVAAAWTAIGSYGTDYNYENIGENNESINSSTKVKYGIYSYGGIALMNNEVSGETVFRGIHPGWGNLAADWSDSATAPYVIYEVKAGSVVSVDMYLDQSNISKYFGDKNFEFTVESAATASGTWGNAVTTASYTANDINILYTVPSDCKYVKITFPQKGKSSLGPRGNDYAKLMGVKFTSP